MVYGYTVDESCSVCLVRGPELDQGGHFWDLFYFRECGSVSRARMIPTAPRPSMVLSFRDVSLLSDIY